MVSSSYQWLCDGHEAIEIALQWSFKAYIDQFEAIAMLLTIITRPIIEMPKGGIDYCFWVAQTLWLKPHGPGPLFQVLWSKITWLRLDWQWTDGQTNIPCILQDIAPLGLLPCSQSIKPFKNWQGKVISLLWPNRASFLKEVITLFINKR